MTHTPKSTAGFYHKNDNSLQFAPTAVHFPDGSHLLVANHAEYTYPVNGWTYYESAEAAYAAEGVEPPAPPVDPRQSIAERIAARRAMTPEQREAEREERELEHIARVEKTDPERAAKMRERLEQRKARRAELLSRRATPTPTPEKTSRARKTKKA